MHETHELRPAPARTPSAVLWLMAMVVLGGSLLLIWAPPPSPGTTLASAASQPTRMPPVHAPMAPASVAPAAFQPPLGTLQVP